MTTLLCSIVMLASAGSSSVDPSPPIHSGFDPLVQQQNEPPLPPPPPTYPIPLRIHMASSGNSPFKAAVATAIPVKFVFGTKGDFTSDARYELTAGIVESIADGKVTTKPFSAGQSVTNFSGTNGAGYAAEQYWIYPNDPKPDSTKDVKRGKSKQVVFYGLNQGDVAFICLEQISGPTGYASKNYFTFIVR